MRLVSSASFWNFTSVSLLSLILLITVTCSTEIPVEFQSEFHTQETAHRLCIGAHFLSPLNCAHGTSFNPALSSSNLVEGEKHCDLIKEKVYFHAIFDFQRPSSLPLFVSQVCRAQTLCIDKPNFRIILHLQRTRTRSKSNKNLVKISKKCNPDYMAAISFLQTSGIPYVVWTGEFDTMTSQTARLVALHDLQPPTGIRTSKWVLQVDADEFPVFYGGFSKLVHTLLHHTDQCDAVYGALSERLPLSGQLLNITLSSIPLTEQFPLVCKLKKSVERAESRKIVLFRADYRPGIGNHKLVCEHSGRRKSPSLEITNCKKIVSKRADMSMLHPPILAPPLQCHAAPFSVPIVPIDHFKYTWGLQQYLQDRVRVFKKKGISWYRESSSVLAHIQMYGGMCVGCTELMCRNGTG